MKKSKLAELLRTFSKNEINRFVDFVSSPYFNKEQVLLKFAEYIQNNKADFDNSDFEKEKIYSSLYPGKKYSDALMRNIISDLLRLAEKFLAVSRMENDAYEEGAFLLEELNLRSSWKQFMLNEQRIEKVLDITGYKNEKYFERKTELKRLHNNFIRSSKDTYVKQNETYQEISDNMTAEFLIKMIYYNTLMVNLQSHISNFSFKLNMADEIDSFLRSSGSDYLKIAYIECYYLFFKLIQTNEQHYYFKLKDFLNNKAGEIDESGRKDIYTVLQSYCYKKVMEGKEEFVKEHFSYYKEEVERGAVFGMVKKYIPAALFMSIAATGFEAGEHDWVENFIVRYRGSLSEDIRDDTYNFCTALKLYWGKNYSNALAELSKVSSEEFALKQNIKSLTLKIYFDLNESESFYSHIDSYRHFILNNKIVHEGIRKQVNNYINFSKRLFDLKNRGDADRDADIEILKNEINSNSALINKIWLMKKADEI
jgi:hypothetical protein